MSELLDQVAVVRFACNEGSALGCSPVRFKEEDSSAKGEIMPTAVKHWL